MGMMTDYEINDGKTILFNKCTDRSKTTAQREREVESWVKEARKILHTTRLEAIRSLVKGMPRVSRETAFNALSETAL